MNVKNEIQVYQNAIIAFSKKELIDKSIHVYAQLISTLCEFENSANQDKLNLANALSDALLVSREMCILTDKDFHFFPISFNSEELKPELIVSIFRILKRNLAAYIMNQNSDFVIGKDLTLSIINRIDYDICKTGYLICRKEFEATYTFTIEQLQFTSQTTGML